MKILHFGKYYPPFLGGVEKVNYDLVEKLNLYDDCQVDELCFAHKVKYQESFFPQRYKLFRVPIWAIKFSTPLPRGLIRTFLRVRNDYDIIHVHVPNPIASLVSLFSPKRVKIVVHWHCDIVKQKTLLKLFRPIQNAFLRRADAIIATSRNYVDSSVDLQPFLSKVRVIPISIDAREMLSRQEDVDVIKNKYDGKKIVLCIGRLTFYKGHRYLIEAAKQLEDDTVVLLGGVGEMEQELKEDVKQNGLVGKVEFLGRIPQDLIYSYYKASDIFCLPSITKAEAFGVVLLEALALGIPIIACDIPGSGVPWVNQDGVTGFNVPVKDASALAEKINLLLRDKDLRKQMSAACVERFNRYYSVDKMVKSTYQVYRQLVENR